MYKNILVPVLLDSSRSTQASYEVARALADEDAKFTVIHVLEAVPVYVEAQIPTEALAESHKVAEAALRRSVEDFPDVAIALVSGHSGQTILEYAEANAIDCIILASHQPNVTDFFLGSTAARVVRHAKCAVHVIR